MKRSVVILLVLLGTVDAYAKVGTVSDAPAVRHGIEMLKGRHEITLTEGVTLSDAYTINLLTQLGYQYHILDWLGVGLEATYGSSFKTSLTSNVENEVTAGEWGLENPGQKYSMSRTGIAAMVLAKVDFVPFSGKLVLFRKFLGYVDLHIDIGGGWALVRGIGRMSNESTGVFMVGGGFRFHPNKYLSVNIEVRDYMIQRALNVPLEGTAKKKFTQNPAFLLGLSVFFPMKPERGF